MRPFQPGDIVELLSGDPWMTVIAFNPGRADGGAMVCTTWVKRPERAAPAWPADALDLIFEARGA